MYKALPTAIISLKSVVTNANDEVLILQRPEDDYSRPNGLDLPGGGLDVGEDPKAGIIREIKEETGIAIQEIKVIDAISFYTGDQFTIMIFFRGKTTQEEIKLSDEHKNGRWMKLSDVLKSDLMSDIYKSILRNI